MWRILFENTTILVILVYILSLSFYSLKFVCAKKKRVFKKFDFTGFYFLSPIGQRKHCFRVDFLEPSFQQIYMLWGPLNPKNMFLVVSLCVNSITQKRKVVECSNLVCWMSIIRGRYPKLFIGIGLLKGVFKR